MDTINFRALKLAAALVSLPWIAAAEPAPAPDAAPAKAPPEKVWQAGLKQIAGKYRFLQIASPGGLWQTKANGNKVERQQVSVSQLPHTLREQLEKAEIQILSLESPTEIDASMEKSPGVGGMVRHYTEKARGKLVMRGLPGIGEVDGDRGEFQGEVFFGIEHVSLTTPSVSGVWTTRFNTEPTWGAAALDFADFTAMKPPKEGQEAADPEFPIFNARILRSGMEIFAYIQWREPQGDQKGKRSEITGAVRLIRVADAPAPAGTGAPAGAF